MVVWKAIPGFDGYEASSIGEVRSIDRVINGGRWGIENRKGRVIKSSLDTYGYPQVSLSVGKRLISKKVHRLVMLAFVGDSELMVNHKDSNRANNRLDNLEYVTAEENVRHSIDKGLSKRIGEGNPNSKFKEADVLRMKELKKSGSTYREIGTMYGIDYRNAHRIISGKQWANLK